MDSLTLRTLSKQTPLKVPFDFCYNNRMPVISGVAQDCTIELQSLTLTINNLANTSAANMLSWCVVLRWWYQDHWHHCQLTCHRTLTYLDAILTLIRGQQVTKQFPFSVHWNLEHAAQSLVPPEFYCQLNTINNAVNYSECSVTGLQASCYCSNH